VTVRRRVFWVGVVLLAAGLGVLGWVGWQYLGTGVVANRTMDKLEQGLLDDWSRPAPEPQKAPELGEAIALVRIPRFGADWRKPVVHGVRDRDLARGVGHYPDTQMPGQTGNFAIAGHRVTHGSVFKRLLDLRPGDEVIVETRDMTYTYVLDTSARDLTVRPRDTWVLEPMPERHKALITLTTCQDLFRSPDRSVAFGHLVSSVRR
jgi:sortase A